MGNADALGYWPAVGLALAVAVGIGVLNGVIVQFVGINAFIVTLGTMTAVRGLVLIYTDGRSLSVARPEIIEEMKAVEGGRLDVGWFVLAVGAVLLLAGIVIALRERDRRKGGLEASTNRSPFLRRSRQAGERLALFGVKPGIDIARVGLDMGPGWRFPW